MPFKPENSNHKRFVLNVNKKFITFYSKTIDTAGKMYYIIGVKVSTHALKVLKSKRKDV